MDDFEYSIQLNDRDWAEFFLESEECNLAPAALATAEEQSLSDIEQGDSVLGRDCYASPEGQITARVGSRPGPGTGTSAPRGVAADTSLCWLLGGHLSLPELLSGSEDEADLSSVSRFLWESDKPGCLSSASMPSVQERQSPCPPAATPAGGTAESSPGQDTACEEATPQPASEEGAASSNQAMEHASLPDGASVPEQCSGGEQPRPALETAPRAPSSPAREEASKERVGMELSSPAGSPDVVRPKVPGQPRKSRKQRGANATEAARGDKEPAGAVAQGTGAAVKTPLSSPLSPRKSKGKEKATKPALAKLGREEAEESKQLVPTPGMDEGDPAVSSPPKQKVKEPEAQPQGKVKEPGAQPQEKVKEPGAQPQGKVKATKNSKPGQAGGLDVPDNVPVIPASRAAAPPGQVCQEAPQKPPHPESMVASGGDAAEEADGEPAAETPKELPLPCFAAEASARADTLEVTWPELYDYFFCDSQGEEEGLGNSMEGEKTPLERETSLPDLYEYFFNEPEGNRKKVKGKDRKRKKFSSLDHTKLQNDEPDSAPVKDSLIVSVPEVYEHFFRDGPRHRVGWSRIFSITPASEVKKAVGALKSLLQKHLVRGQAPASQALVRRGSGEKFSLVPLAPLGRGQMQTEGLDMALALRGGPETPLALTQKDMCLVFCAFASWAVKTSDLQAPDAWKTMFLASFGTLSAIRYFRRQVREGYPRT
ncbi:PERM1 protein, partial [Galbula dea]|nr:PERM1 protein [Galbula dea]